MEVMKFSRQELLNLSVDVYNRKSSDERYSAEERANGLREYLKDLSKDYRNNKNQIFTIIEDTANTILPKKVGEIFNQFAEFKTVGDGETIRFRVKNGKIKAHVMAVGSVAERQRVDHGFITIKAKSVQAKIYDEYDRFVSGLVDWTEMMNDVISAIMEEIYKMVQSAFEKMYANMPQTNTHTAPTLDEAEFKKLLSVVKAYGSPVIMGTPLAVAQLPLTANASELDKIDLRNLGRLGMYNGCPVIELPNSFEDESNTTPVLDDKNIYIIPSGAEKVIKVALEGGMHTRDTDGTDWTINFEAYQKVAVSILATNNIAVYRLA